MNRLIESLNRFVLVRARKPLWVLGWAVFVGAFSFAVDLYMSAPERLANFAKERAAIGEKSIEMAQIMRVNEALTAALEAAEPASGFYKDHLASLSPPNRLSQELLESGARLTSEARRAIAKATGTIDGIAFANDQLGRYSQGLRANLQGIDKSMAIQERFFRAYSFRGSEPAIRELQAADIWIFADGSDAVAAFTRLRSWHEKAIALVDQVLADDEALFATMRSYTIRLRMSTWAVVYCVAFLSVAFRSWRHSRSRGRRAITIPK